MTLTCLFYIPQPYKSLLFWLFVSHTQVASVYQGLIWGRLLGCWDTLFSLSIFSACNTGCKGHSYLVHAAQPWIKTLIDVSIPIWGPAVHYKCHLGLTLIIDECTECGLLWFNKQCLGPRTLKTPLQWPKYYCNFYIHQLSLKICLVNTISFLHHSLSVCTI